MGFYLKLNYGMVIYLLGMHKNMDIDPKFITNKKMLKSSKIKNGINIDKFDLAYEYRKSVKKECPTLRNQLSIIITPNRALC